MFILSTTPYWLNPDKVLFGNVKKPSSSTSQYEILENINNDADQYQEYLNKYN